MLWVPVRPARARLKPAGFVLPCQPCPADRPPSGPDWQHEIKWDGYRIITRNPWNSERTCGGSSGGDAVALATGMTPLGLGNDIGGSLRNPANACGIASICPSLGRVPHAGLVPAEESPLAAQLMNVEGPMARTIGDVRLALGILVGPHPRDPWSLDAPLVHRRANSPIRVAMVAEPPGGGTDPKIAAVVRDAGAVLSRAGYEVVEIAPPRYEDAITTWLHFLVGDFASVLDQLRPIMGKDAVAFIDWAGSPRAAARRCRDVWGLCERDGIARAWSQFMAEYPLVLTPTGRSFPSSWVSMSLPGIERGGDGNRASGGAGKSSGPAVSLRTCGTR